MSVEKGPANGFDGRLLKRRRMIAIEALVKFSAQLICADTEQLYVANWNSRQRWDIIRKTAD